MDVNYENRKALERCRSLANNGAHLTHIVATVDESLGKEVKR